MEGQRTKVENGFGGRMVVSRRLRNLEKQVAKVATTGFIHLHSVILTKVFKLIKIEFH